ncbi:hypothetical protein [Plantactinospora sp. KBS50]|uniref:hypothetical protein n=1 Tax=Plantactinospora sp. KBS50 TaxID=2024580 RepID=UPI0012FDC4AA|nr:hypothetical protein [Plantactinospora sp. KBS50]
MTDEVDDRQLWAALVAAEQECARRRSEFYRHAWSRTEILSKALAGGVWDQAVALEFLDSVPHDVPALLHDLVEHAVSQRWAGLARRAIAGADRQRTRPVLRRIVSERLRRADDNEYRRLAELLAEVEDWPMLQVLLQSAADSTDLRVRAVSPDLAQRYGPLCADTERRAIS